MVRAAIEISPSAIRTRVSKVGPEGADGLVDRFVSLRVRQSNLGQVEAIVADGAGAARSAGAEGVELVFSSDLRGTRLARLIERRVDSIVSTVRSPETGARIATRFVAATVGHRPSGSAGTAFGVAGLGHASLGIAIGRPGEAPEWVGSRPLGLDRVSSKARFQDPPSPVQLEVARVSSARSLGTLHPPEFDSLLVVSDFEPVITDLCGSEVSDRDLDVALEWTLGRTSDELSAITGFGPHLARLLPAAIAVHQALVDTFESTLIPVSPDPAAEIALADLVPAGGPGTRQEGNR